MKIRYIAFKWHVDAPLNAVIPILLQIGLQLGKPNIWSRSIGEHSLQVEYREKMSCRQFSYFWIRFLHPSAATDKGILGRVLADWFFACSKQLTTHVNWMQVALDIEEFHPPFGFSESSQAIWTKLSKQHRFSVYPYLDHHLYEVRNEDIRKGIQHQRFSTWIEELKHNLLGHERPDDQIRFDLVV
ncbi:MAG: hypothetical protein ACE3L7_14555 [Candidatus Pristimantibacillus sp.]